MANKWASQKRAPLAVRREPAVIQNRPPNMLYVFQHKTRYIPIHAPHTRTMAFWHTVYTPNDFIESNLQWYPHISCGTNICEILLYNRQLVVQFMSSYKLFVCSPPGTRASSEEAIYACGLVILNKIDTDRIAHIWWGFLVITNSLI